MYKNLAFALSSLFISNQALAAKVISADENIAIVKMSIKEARLFSAYDEVDVIFEDGEAIEGRIVKKLKGRKAKILLSEKDLLQEGDDISIEEPNNDDYEDDYGYDDSANSISSRISVTTGRTWLEADIGDNFAADLYNASLLLRHGDSPLVFGADLSFIKYKLENGLSGKFERIDFNLAGGFSKRYGEIEPYVLGQYNIYSKAIFDVKQSGYEDGTYYRGTMNGDQKHANFLAFKLGTIFYMNDNFGLTVEGVKSTEYRQTTDSKTNFVIIDDGYYDNSYEESKDSQKINHNSLALGFSLSF